MEYEGDEIERDLIYKPDYALGNVAKTILIIGDILLVSFLLIWLFQ